MSNQSGFDPAPLAAQLHAAWNTRIAIEPFSESSAIENVEQAYAVQQAWADLRAAEGEVTIGRKIGLTSPGMQQQMGVGEPDYGDLWGSRHIDGSSGGADVSAGLFIQPRVEGEVAFLMGRGLQGPNITEADVLAAADAAALSIEIVDSRIQGWRIKLVDTVADNASYGAIVCGEWSEMLLHSDLAARSFSLALNGQTSVAETGAAVLGSPLTAVAWLANKLSGLGIEIKAGDIVLSGSFGKAVPAAAGDLFVVASPNAGSLTVQITT